MEGKVGSRASDLQSESCRHVGVGNSLLSDVFCILLENKQIIRNDKVTVEAHDGVFTLVATSEIRNDEQVCDVMLVTLSTLSLRQYASLSSTKTSGRR
jgi:hypothetical protein